MSSRTRLRVSLPSLFGTSTSFVNVLVRISIFALSTYDTDYVLVQDQDLPRACEALTEAGHTVHA